MRVLLDQECAAVAGGNPFADAEPPDSSSDLAACEEAVTTTAIVGGAVVGGAIGSSAGGMGVVPGAIVGGSAGQLVAQVAAPPYCRYTYRNRFEGGGGGGSAAAWRGTIIHQFGETNSYAAHQLIVVPVDENDRGPGTL